MEQVTIKGVAYDTISFIFDLNISEKYMRIFSICILGVSLILISCSSDPTSNYKELDLLQYGVPVVILAPDSPKVETMDFVVQQDITIKSGDDYYVQIYASKASTYDLGKLKASQLAEVKSNEFFSEIINEDNDGFIYKLEVDSTYTSYGFRHFKIMGDKEFIFQPGLVGTFSQDQIENLYSAVRNKK
jgi:hypothetical protein